MQQTAWCFLSIAALLVWANSSLADEPVSLDQLQQQIQRQQEQIDALQKGQTTPPHEFKFLDRDLFVHRSNADSDFRHRVNIIGRIHADALFAAQTPKNQEIYGDLLNTVGFRRARLGAEGDIHRDVYWKAEFDFAGGDITFRDVYVALRNLPVVNEFRVGHFREPFSLEGAISANVMTFLERSTINQFDPGRNWGLGVFSYTPDERITWALAAFRSGANSAGQVASDSNDLAYDLRVTALPWFDDAGERYRLMHLGGAASYRFPLNNLVQFSPKRELIVSDDSPPSPLTNPIVISASDWQLYNLSWAGVVDSWSIQAEWTGTYITQLAGSPIFFHGFYVQTSYFLTGEHRQYDRKAGIFDHIHVRSPWIAPQGCDRGWGAWEIAARFDYLDMRDQNLPPQPNPNFQGERILTGTFGLNWYLNDYTRLMCNYTYAVPQDVVAGPSAAHLFGLRLAIHW